MAEFNPNLPPQNIEAEQSVLGGILIDNQTFHKVVDVVLPDDFYRPAHGKIYNAMRDLAAKGDPIDVVSLTSKMKELDIYEEAGGASYLAELLERVPTAVNSEYHAKLVSDQALKRRLVSACNELATKGMDPTEKPLELLDEAEKPSSDSVLPKGTSQWPRSEILFVVPLSNLKRGLKTKTTLPESLPVTSSSTR